ncbi:MAG: hypothetical protein ACREMY_17250, partial [bacterium]
MINLDLGINALAPSFYPGADSVAGAGGTGSSSWRPGEAQVRASAAFPAASCPARFMRACGSMAAGRC